MRGLVIANAHANRRACWTKHLPIPIYLSFLVLFVPPTIYTCLKFLHWNTGFSFFSALGIVFYGCEGPQQGTKPASGKIVN